MISSFGTHQIYLAQDTIDMRKSINGLITIVQACFRLDPFSSAMFVFTNRQRNKIKILQWDMNGFWIHYKRLESGKFQWPRENRSEVVLVDRRQLGWLLDGLSIHQLHAHRKSGASLAV